MSFEHGPRRVVVQKSTAPGQPKKPVGTVACDTISLYQGVYKGMQYVVTDSKLGENFVSDSFKAALAGGKLTLELAGKQREINVAMWYLQGELYGAKADEPAAQVGLALAPVPDDKLGTIYDNFGFGVDSSEIEEVSTYFVQFNAALAKLPSTKDPANGLVPLEVFQKAPLRIGVLGVTGAGKSTFVTAMLGRAVLSRSTEICTAAVTVIEHIGDAKTEHFIVEYLTVDEKNYFVEADQAKLAKLEEAVKIGPACAGPRKESEECKKVQMRLETQRTATVNLAAAVLKWRVDRQTVQGLDTDPFVSAVGGNRLPELIKTVTLHLDEDVLRYATFLDTPGLRDPDPKRRRIAIDNIAKMDGWIYLMQAGKAETGVLDDLAEIRDEAGNMHGVICISKVNLLNDPSAQKTLEQLVKPQRDLFQSYSSMPITYDSAMARAQIALIKQTPDAEQRFELLRDILDQSYGFGFIRRLVPSLRDQTFSDPLKDAFQGLVEHASQHNGVHDSDTHSKDFMLLEDVLTETSLLVTTMRNIAELLQDKIVRRVAENRRTELVTAISTNAASLHAREAAMVELITAFVNLTETRVKITAEETALQVAAEAEKAVLAVIGCVADQFSDVGRGAMAAAHATAEKRAEEVDGVVSGWFWEQYAEVHSEEDGGTLAVVEDGDKFRIRAMRLPWHDLFGLPIKDEFEGALQRLKAAAKVSATECAKKHADGQAVAVVEKAHKLMEEMLSGSVAQFDLEALRAADTAVNTQGTNACWCTTNVVSRERSQCSDSVCVTLSMQPPARGKAAIRSPKKAAGGKAPGSGSVESIEALAAIQRMSAEQMAKQLVLLTAEADKKLTVLVKEVETSKETIGAEYQAKTAEVAAGLEELRQLETMLEQITDGETKVGAEQTLKQATSDADTLLKFHNDLIETPTFKYAAELAGVAVVEVPRAPEAPLPAGVKAGAKRAVLKLTAAGQPHDGLHDL